jgi:hypothetical protein
MDFDALNTKADAERGAVLHLRHPQIKHPLYAGDGADKHGRKLPGASPKPVTVTILGAEAGAFQEAMRKFKRLSEDERENERHVLALLTHVVIGMDGVTRKNDAGEMVEVKADAEGLKYLLSRSDNFGAQMIEFVMDAANFFNEGLDD